VGVVGGGVLVVYVGKVGGGCWFFGGGRRGVLGMGRGLRGRGDADTADGGRGLRSHYMQPDQIRSDQITSCNRRRSAHPFVHVLGEQLGDEVLGGLADGGLGGEGEGVAQDVLKRLLAPLAPG